MTTNYVYNTEQVCNKVNSMSTKADPGGLTLQTRTLKVIAKNFNKSEFFSNFLTAKHVSNNTTSLRLFL